jgi:nucleotide-binding universal stress UspA family protein
VTRKHVLAPPALDPPAGASDPAAQPWRLVLAHDLSPGAELATRVIADATWPYGSTVRVLTSAVGIGPMLSSFANIRESRAHARTVRQLVAVAHESAASRLEGAGLTVETRMVGGAPAGAILGEARRSQADLIVVGARDQGPIATAVLGSVSRSIVERARCSVLVVRGGRLSRVLLATDDSPAATAAVRLVAAAPLFAGAQTHVIAVGDGPPPVPVMALDRPVTEPGTAPVGDARRPQATLAEVVASDAFAALRATGCEVHAEVRLGDPATEIVAVAREWLPDVVVIGSNGEPLLRRLLLGSVTRKVIDGVRASVLVVRPPTERVEAAASS